MKKVLSLALGVFTAIGGFIDIGDLITDALIGARFGLALVWVTVVAVIGVALYSEMAGRVAVVTRRTVFDLIRERMGARTGLAAVVVSYLVNAIALIAELCGIALAIELLTDVHYLLWVPPVAFLAWLVVWRVPFAMMERVYGLAGMALFVFVVAVWHLGPDWGQMAHDVTHPSLPFGEGLPTYFFYALVMLGAQMTPYEVFFFSSAAVEHRWRARNLMEVRMNCWVGYPIGGILAIGIQVVAHQVLQPAGIQVENLSQTVLPVVLALGKVGLALAVLGIVAAVFGSTIETLLSSGYTVAHHFGWTWGKTGRPADASRFHTLLLVTLLAAVAVALTTINPVTVTIYAVYLGAAVLPVTYLPILVIANDRRYLGDRVNGRVANAVGVVYLVIVVAGAVAALPLLIATKAGL
ncbi:NRAMP family divalent metal transporter [Streptomyces sp. DH24]|uniref:NRAMP family divalent metal transporter n=1 Tax=Streptomyces sp. DH24 TaxID=3040123 RepID=UPI002443537B|nr:divalent metal cation transporter [Streptomyces sp. DH24]MDG9715613.1 divalent metal cation transporter [Streptomyces sp. DH24]